MNTARFEVIDENGKPVALPDDGVIRDGWRGRADDAHGSGIRAAAACGCSTPSATPQDTGRATASRHRHRPSAQTSRPQMRRTRTTWRTSRTPGVRLLELRQSNRRLATHTLITSSISPTHGGRRDDHRIDQAVQPRRPHTAAFAAGARSEDVGVLIGEVDAAAVEAVEANERARARALDPTIPTADVATHRRDMEEAAFRRDRLLAAKERLAVRLDELRGMEEDARRTQLYESARSKRDALAAELARLYPPVVAQLSDLLARMVESDRELDYVNTRRLPRGASRLRAAEAVARGVSGFVDRGVDIPRITRALRLPSYEMGSTQPFAWPPE